ncbi:hypothetical protein LG201_01630 [Methylobacillus gramineus]|uniref:hypothetical protein n=1 Tax=Methylobacillus gramineus TaxID=755169 RepID=UPI001D000E6A|nr:hypothetical protein [Methylobacillus gramineus]MCB5183902.1 hypothetical protein [Methylobacillus gramineus]
MSSTLSAVVAAFILVVSATTYADTPQTHDHSAHDHKTPEQHLPYQPALNQYQAFEPSPGKTSGKLPTKQDDHAGHHEMEGHAEHDHSQHMQHGK